MNNRIEKLLERFHSRPELQTDTLILVCSAVFVVFYNTAFFSNVYQQYSLDGGNFAYMVSFAVFLYAVTVLLFGLLCFRYTVKPLLMMAFPLAAVVSYFMDRYNIVVDAGMINNVLATDRHEVFDLMSLKLALYVLVLGLLPAWWILRIRIAVPRFRKSLLYRLALLGGSVTAILLLVAMSSQHYASFFREHKILRYYANPVTALYSLGRYTGDMLKADSSQVREKLGMDARIPATDKDRELIILVLGETARADHFSLNGYDRDTNPQLSRLKVINFTNMTSCATSTALSLPCMFSLQSENGFDVDDADNSENLLDVIQHAGGHVLWRDNNSDSKGIAEDVVLEDFRDPANNPVCDSECRDVGMLPGLDNFIAGQQDGDIVIVLHQMGNHGPAYYKRYPQNFEKFTPVCRTNDLEMCSEEEINNAYDNAILYTDYFLSQVIAFLKEYDDRFETAMFYISDHGESLGEHGLYLHGLPNILAPDEQRHVPAIMWFGSSYKINSPELKVHANDHYSHDNFFHTVLGFMEIQTSVYDPELDIIHGAHHPVIAANYLRQ